MKPKERVLEDLNNFNNQEDKLSYLRFDYLNSEEFELLAFVKSFYHYRNIKKLDELSPTDRKLFEIEWKKAIKQDGRENTLRYSLRAFVFNQSEVFAPIDNEKIKLIDNFVNNFFNQNKETKK